MTLRHIRVVLLALLLFPLGSASAWAKEYGPYELCASFEGSSTSLNFYAGNILGIRIVSVKPSVRRIRIVNQYGGGVLFDGKPGPGLSIRVRKSNVVYTGWTSSRVGNDCTAVSYVQIYQ